MGGPTAGQFGMMSTTQPTAADQDAFTKRQVARAEYGRAWQGGGFPRYAGGIAQRLEEQKRNKELMEARRQAWEDSLKERETKVKESELEEKRKQNEWTRKGGALGVGGGTEEAPGAPATSGAPISSAQAGQIQNRPQAGPTGSPQALPLYQGEAPQITPREQPVPTQTGPSPFPPETGSFNTPGGRIVVPEESARNDPMLKPGTWLMNNEGKTRRIYGEPKPSLGDDPFAYTPNVPRPTIENKKPTAEDTPIVNKKRQLQPLQQNQNTVMGDIGRTAADMFYHAPMNAIGKENINAAAQTARDMFVSPIQNALTIPEGQKEFRLGEAKKKRESVWKGMDWLSKYVLGGVR